MGHTAIPERAKRPVVRLTLIVAVLATLAAALAFGPVARAWRRGPVAEAGPAEPFALRVKTVRPQPAAGFALSVQAPASVEGFFQAELMARVAGTVKFVGKAIGDPVKRGELLVELDVPDQARAVDHKAALVEERRSDLRLAEQTVEVRKSGLAAAQAAIRAQKSLVVAAEARLRFAGSEYNRYRDLAESKNAASVEEVEEKLKNYQANQATLDSAKVDVIRIEAAAAEAAAQLEAARSDVGVKRSMVEVARRDLDVSQAVLDLARLRAPFDGVVVQRQADPGSFVANASTGGRAPILTVLRTDIVTVCMRVPDSHAAYVTVGTPVTIQLDELRGQRVEAAVTRIARAIEGRDRTMRVEVDLFNGSAEEHARAVRDGLACYLAPLAAAGPAEAATLAVAGESLGALHRKGNSPLVPPMPRVVGEGRRLLPGMYGSMRLHLRRPGDDLLLPSGAVFSRGGQLYLIEVRDGRAHLLPVRVLQDDGLHVKVAVVRRTLDARHGEVEELHDLTGREEIIPSGQGEITEGQAVATAGE